MSIDPIVAHTPMHALVPLLRGRSVVVLTGAGCSTASGIPDYRGPNGVMQRRTPVQYRDFMTREAVRRRYWTRSVVGWPVIAQAKPNEAHHALALLERAGRIRGVITQNVDGLHQRAGSARVVELHGALRHVRCTACGATELREALQRRLLALNPSLASREADIAPDGDADLDGTVAEHFVFAPCLACGGVMLKPDVVFFGENVAREVVDDAWRMFDGADVLLVAGSSLAVFSGYRFVVRAAERGMAVVIVNRGDTRGDRFATLKVDADVGRTLAALNEDGWSADEARMHGA